MTTDDVERIAASLTEPQRRALLALYHAHPCTLSGRRSNLPGTVSGRSASWLCDIAVPMLALRKVEDGFYAYRITPDGTEVARVLEQSNGES